VDGRRGLVGLCEPAPLREDRSPRRRNVVLLLATRGASAHNADTTAVLRTLRIREVGITGTQTAPVRNARSHTPLFDRKAFAAEPVQTLEAALRLAPSVDIRERGGKGAQADISVRGGSFDQTMVLLNGIDFTDARTGHQSHALPVDLDCISSVELLDGLPGVGAFAGAVNVRTAPLRPTYLRFEGAGGQYGYAYANLSGAVTEGRLSVLGAASSAAATVTGTIRTFPIAMPTCGPSARLPVPDCSISRPDTEGPGFRVQRILCGLQLPTTRTNTDATHASRPVGVEDGGGRRSVPFGPVRT